MVSHDFVHIKTQHVFTNEQLRHFKKPGWILPRIGARIDYRNKTMLVVRSSRIRKMSETLSVITSTYACYSRMNNRESS